MERDDGPRIESVARDHEALARIDVVRLPPSDEFFDRIEGVLRVRPCTFPVLQPFGSILEELGRPVGVRKEDVHGVAVGLPPITEDIVLCVADFLATHDRRCTFLFAVGECGEDHGELMRIRAFGFETELHCEQCIRCAREILRAEHLRVEFDVPLLPQEIVAAAGAEVGEVQVLELAEHLDLLPCTGFAECIEDVELALVEECEPCTIAQSVHDDDGVDLPEGDLAPRTFEREFPLPILRTPEGVLRQTQVAQEVDELSAEDVLPAVELIAREPDELVFPEGERAHMVELRTELGLVDDLGEAHTLGAVHEAEADLGLREEHPDELEHQDLVEVDVEEGSDDPVVVKRMVMRSFREVHSTSRGTA